MSTRAPEPRTDADIPLTDPRGAARHAFVSAPERPVPAPSLLAIARTAVAPVSVLATLTKEDLAAVVAADVEEICGDPDDF